MSFYERVLRPLLFRVGGGDAEAAHDLAIKTLARSGGALRPVKPYSPPGAARTVFGIRFPNPVGVAAGLDKNGRALRAWPALGFGFVELGTVTWHRQGPNDRPRLLRLPRSEAIINRMGFPNDGALEVATRLARLRGLKYPLGISIGRSKIVDNEKAVEDYIASLRLLHPHGDYFVVNVSSPNTPGLRDLQDRRPLTNLIEAVIAEESLLSAGRPSKPVLVKVAPDLTLTALGELLQVCVDTGVQGIVATNTSVSRHGLNPVEQELGRNPGGLSGAPIAERVRQVVSFVTRETGERLPVVGVGGVMSPDDACRLMDAGASLIQIYTGLIYRGPSLIRESVRRMAGR